MTDFSYPEVGATTPGRSLPGGYRHLRFSARIGSGRAQFEAAGEAVVSWRMHRALPVRVTASAEQAAPGVRVGIGLGLGRAALQAPCRVVWTVRDADRIGFAYGTLPGHPEQGEESFLAELAPDGAVCFRVTAFSRPARWFTRAAGPAVPLFQRLYARRCAAVLRAAARQAPAAG